MHQDTKFFLICACCTTITLYKYLLITTNSIGQSHVWQVNLYFPLSKLDIDCLCFLVVKLDCVFGADLDMYEIGTVSEVRCILSLSLSLSQLRYFGENIRI